jgi:hypothetical protein
LKKSNVLNGKILGMIENSKTDITDTNASK